MMLNVKFFTKIPLNKVNMNSVTNIVVLNLFDVEFVENRPVFYISNTFWGVCC